MSHCKVFGSLVVGLLATFIFVQRGMAQAVASAPPDKAAAKAAFDQRFAEYKEQARKIEQMQSDYQTANPGRRDEIDAQLLEATAAVKTSLDAMVAAALDLYRAAPNDDGQITELLSSVARFYSVGEPPKSENGTLNGGDSYERALPIIEVLIANKAKEPQLPIWGFISAFAVNDFDLAQKYLELAKESQVLADPRGLKNDSDKQVMGTILQLAPRMDEYRALWAKEQEIRAKEAAADDLPRVKLSTTKGDIVIELFENEAPQATANFITLAKSGYYNNIAFHRVLPMFMAQGGDPKGDGTGGPGYTIRDEVSQPNYRHHFRGSLSMAKTAMPDTGGSQFFLTFIETPHLDGKHTVFGRVVDGIDVLGELQKRDPSSPSAPTPDRIIKAEVLRDRGHEYTFDKLPER